MIHNRATSMCHVGMNREAMREAVQSLYKIGQQYLLKSQHEDIEKKDGFARCKLVSFSRTAAVFEHGNGIKESFAYQDIWRMQMDGEIL